MTSQATAASDSAGGSEIEPYQLHVSQRWLDLTRRKLELARLPREPPPLATAAAAAAAEDRQEPLSREHGSKGEEPVDIWKDGVPKAELEALLDFWLESYDHRAQEAYYNTRLPQYRCKSLTIASLSSMPPSSTSTSSPAPAPTSTSKFSTSAEKPTLQTIFRNIHFVHRPSNVANAIPLLLIPTFGSSFVEIARVIEGLADPVSTPTPQTLSTPQPQAFHVICPSIPGFGFSDTAAAVGEERGFGVHGAAEVLVALMEKLGYPRFLVSGDDWGFLVARAIAVRWPERCIGLHTAGLFGVPRPTVWRQSWTWLCFHMARLTAAKVSWLRFGYVPADFEHIAQQKMDSPFEASSVFKTQTSAYALADSPTALLALLLDLIGPTSLRSLRKDSRAQEPSIQDAWTPSEIILWTMMYWLPGPEAPLRWLRNAAQESAPTGPLWRSWSQVPLGVSVFGSCRMPPAWAGAYHNVRWVRRHMYEASRPAWEAPETFVMDLRAFAQEVVQ